MTGTETGWTKFTDKLPEEGQFVMFDIWVQMDLSLNMLIGVMILKPLNH